MKSLEANPPLKSEGSLRSDAAQAALPAPFSMPFAAGDVIAEKYEVIRLIGAGGMGFVISATHVELRHEVALKFLRPELLVHRELVARFVREARTAVMIKSEHVARVFDVGNIPDAGPFIAMELLEGQDLGRVVAERGALPSQLAVDYIMQACEALATAHAARIVHRDVKPENLFLTKTAPGVDIIKVLDFGISKVALADSPANRPPFVQTIMAVGSPTYMSPEQVRASKDVDARADIWALGCVLYELLSGAAAFDAPSLTQLSAKILECHPAPLRSQKPDILPELDAVIMRCLQKDPSQRFQNVGELASALCPFASNSSRLVAGRCRYVLDPAASLADNEPEDTVPSSWNGLSSGIDTPIAKSLAGSESRRLSRRVTAAARRLAGDRRRFFPVLVGVAVAVLAGMHTLSRALRSDSTTDVSYTVPQTVLTSPAAKIELLMPLAEPLGDSPMAAPSQPYTTPSASASADVQRARIPLVIARTSLPFVKAAPPKRPPARPKAIAASEPDVGF